LTTFNLKHLSLICSRRDIFTNKRLNLIELFHEGSHLSNYFKYNYAISCKLPTFIYVYVLCFQIQINEASNSNQSIPNKKTKIDQIIKSINMWFTFCVFENYTLYMHLDIDGFFDLVDAFQTGKPPTFEFPVSRFLWTTPYK
jgi:hypothetical protein